MDQSHCVVRKKESHIFKKTDSSANQVFRATSYQDENIVFLNRKEHFSDVLAMTDTKNKQNAGWFLTGNQKRKIYVENSTAGLIDCPQFLSPYYECDKFQVLRQISCVQSYSVFYTDSLTSKAFRSASFIKNGDFLYNNIVSSRDRNAIDVLMLNFSGNNELKISNFIKNTEVKGPHMRALWTNNSDSTLKLLDKAIIFELLTMRKELIWALFSFNFKIKSTWCPTCRASRFCLKRLPNLIPHTKGVMSFSKFFLECFLKVYFNIKYSIHCTKKLQVLFLVDYYFLLNRTLLLIVMMLTLGGYEKTF